MKKFQKIGLVLAFGLGSVSVANASVVYTNLGDIGIFSAQQVLSSGWMASEFSPEQNCASGCVLNSVILRLNGGDLGATVDPAHISLGIYSDGGTLPGSLLYTLNTAAVDISFDQNVAFSFTPIAGQSGILNPAQSYWTRLSTSSNDGISWIGTDSGTLGARAYQRDGGLLKTSSNTPWMFEVQATPVAHLPIPGAIWFMGSALAGMGVLVRRKTV